MDMTPVLTQMGILVFIMAVGFLCTKIGVTGPEFTRSGSKVVLNVLLVFTILDSVTSADMELSLSAVGVDLLAYFALIFISAALGLLCAKLIGGRRDCSGIATFAVAFSNTVFVGFPVIESIYGSEGILVATLSNVPFNLLVYTMGVAMINGSAKGMNVKNAISAPLVATIIAVAFFMTGIKLPDHVVQCFDIIGGGTVPMSMLVVRKPGQHLRQAGAQRLAGLRRQLCEAHRLPACYLARAAAVHTRRDAPRRQRHTRRLPHRHDSHRPGHTRQPGRGLRQPDNLRQHGALSRDHAAHDLAAAVKPLPALPALPGRGLRFYRAFMRRDLRAALVCQFLTSTPPHICGIMKHISACGV